MGNFVNVPCFKIDSNGIKVGATKKDRISHMDITCLAKLQNEYLYEIYLCESINFPDEKCLCIKIITPSGDYYYEYDVSENKVPLTTINEIKNSKFNICARDIINGIIRGEIDFAVNKHIRKQNKSKKN